ncbi:MAG: DUF4432 family protein [Terracidiphilus sp.]|jgi:hypothetical protein
MLVASERWRDRDALRLSNGLIEAVLLPGGGHLAELRLASPNSSSVNCLWDAPWLTSDPSAPGTDKLASLYGGGPIGSFLAGYTGHALCLDNFGMPTDEEARHGIPLHGEAASIEWQIETTAQGCVCRANLPGAMLNIERKVSLSAVSSLILVDECVTNRGEANREIQWVQHVSLGPPFLSLGSSSVHASLDLAITSPMGYEGHDMLRGGETFDWPEAPSIDGSDVNLQYPFQHAVSGFVVGARVDVSRHVAYIAALNWKYGIALIYCFRRKDFPWVAIWEENKARMDHPWDSTAQVRGMEFGTTPMPLGREAMRKQGSLFNTPTSIILAAGESRRACYAISIAAVPSHWTKITNVEASRYAVTIVGPESNDRVEIEADDLHNLLQ